jgi:hypothetical protein
VNFKSRNPSATPGRVAMGRRPQRAVLSVVAALIALGASACGAGGHPSQGSGPPDVCKLLPPSQVSAVTGNVVTQATGQHEDEFPAPAGAACTYGNRKGLSIWVEVLPHLDGFYRKNAYLAASNSVIGGQGAAPVVMPAGVGDKAIASGAGIAALAGDVVIEITGVPQDLSGDHSQVIHLARMVISALGH